MIVLEAAAWFLLFQSQPGIEQKGRPLFRVIGTPAYDGRDYLAAYVWLKNVAEVQSPERRVVVNIPR